MKKLILIFTLTFLSSTIFAQVKKDTTITLPIKGDTVNISTLKFLRTSKGIFAADLLNKTDFFLTKDQIEYVIAQIGTLPFNESEKAIALIRQLFGLPKPK